VLNIAPRLAICVATSLVLTILSLAFAAHDLSAVLCLGIAIASTLGLFVFGVAKKGRQRVVTLFVVLAYVFTAMLLMQNYSLVRDNVRWFFLSGGYKARVLAQSSGVELKHAEWDGWGFAGIANTTAFLVFDPSDSLAGAVGAQPPIKTRVLPCEVFRVRRLERQWYAVLFYTDTYWGEASCK
jgi:hypothetical protein